jgi:hypothetical protein
VQAQGRLSELRAELGLDAIDSAPTQALPATEA